MKTSFEQDLSTLLRQSESCLDADTRTELARIRNGVKPSSPRLRAFAWSRNRPAAVVAMASIALVVATVLIQHSAIRFDSPAQLSNNLDLYENFDFYYWLAEPGSEVNG